MQTESYQNAQYHSSQLKDAIIRKWSKLLMLDSRASGASASVCGDCPSALFASVSIRHFDPNNGLLKK